MVLSYSIYIYHDHQKIETMKKHIDPYKIMEVGDHFGRGQAPIQNQDHPSSELSTCLPWWFYALHLWGSGYDSVSNCPYKINGKNACFRGSTPWYYKGNCQGDIEYMFSLLYFISFYWYAISINILIDSFYYLIVNKSTSLSCLISDFQVRKPRPETCDTLPPCSFWTSLNHSNACWWWEIGQWPNKNSASDKPGQAYPTNTSSPCPPARAEKNGEPHCSAEAQFVGLFLLVYC